MPASHFRSFSSNSLEFSSSETSFDHLDGILSEMKTVGSDGEEPRILSSREEIRVSKKGRELHKKESRKLHNFIPRAKKRDSSAGSENSLSSCHDSPDAGHFVLKRARELIAGDQVKRALDHALRAVKAFEISGKPCLNLVMSLHVLAAIYTNLGQHEQAIDVLQRSIQISQEQLDEVEGKDQALAKFSGQMQLGDVYSMIGQQENSIACYSSGLQTQTSALGPMDARVGETCRFLAEIHLQSLQLQQASSLCKTALDIHRETREDPPLEEIADLKLMGFICQIKGDHEEALTNLLKASSTMDMIGEFQGSDCLDCSIGDAFLSLARYPEAANSYRRALEGGERKLATVAHALVGLADLYSRMGRFKQSKAHCEEALSVYSKQELANEEKTAGLVQLAAVYETLGEKEEAISLLKKALKLCEGSLIALAGIEAQIGVIYYGAGDLAKSRDFLESAVWKLRSCGEKVELAFLGAALNQMGLVLVQLSEVEEAARVFLEAMGIMEKEKGAFHPDTIEVCGNLAATYDAMGRWREATRMMEHVVSAREEKLGTASAGVDGEKRRLAEMLKESGRVRNRKNLTLNFLFARENCVAADKKTTTAL